MSDSHDAQPLWHGRFAEGPAEELWEYTLSLPFDQRLARFDIRGCRAHVAGLGVAGILSPGDVEAVEAALDTTEAELASGEFAFVDTDEDIHTAIERRVTELAGPAGAKLHTGRSRNDQCATDLRLWCKRRQSPSRRQCFRRLWLHRFCRSLSLPPSLRRPSPHRCCVPAGASLQPRLQ